MIPAPIERSSARSQREDPRPREKEITLRVAGADDNGQTAPECDCPIAARTSFDRQGRVMESERFVPYASEYARSVYSYGSDADKEPVETVRYDDQGNAFAKRVVTHDRHRRVTSYTDTYTDGKTLDRWMIVRNDVGGLSEAFSVHTYTREGFFEQTYEVSEHWLYDDRERLTAHQYHREPDYLEESTFAYDGDTQTETRHVHATSGPGTFTTRREYDERGNLLFESSVDPGTGQECEERLTYNEQGHLIEDETYSSETGGANCVRYEYEYDESGNWTKRTRYMRYSDSSEYEVCEVQYRTITYYDEE